MEAMKELRDLGFTRRFKLSTAGRICDLNPAYIRRLIRMGLVEGMLVRGQWYLDEAQLKKLRGEK